MTTAWGSVSDGDDMNLRALIGRWCLEENRDVGGSGTADDFLTLSGLLGFALSGDEAHVDVRCVRGSDSGWLL